MSKGTSIKDALAKWSKENEQPAPEAEEIKLICQLPPIDKMDTRFLVVFFYFLTWHNIGTFFI